MPRTPAPPPAPAPAPARAPSPRRPAAPQPAIALALLLAFAVLAFAVARGGSPADLRASWIAAQLFAEGRGDLIYPGGALPFQMRPPAEWAAVALAGGYAGELYPYIYPPLWAALLAPLTGLLGFDAFLGVASMLNPLLLAATLWLAWRVAGGRLPLAQWLAVAAVVLLPTTLGAHPLLQQQPQILAAFLCLLAIERGQAGAWRVAGAALALAAAIKIFPALYALFWLAQGRRQPVLAFAVAGVALAGLSLALAGWPLHAVFLREMAAISATGLVNGVAYNADATVAQLAFRADLSPVVSLYAGPVPDGAGGVFVTAKTAGWLTASRLALAGTLALCLLLFRRARHDPQATVLLWPAAMAALALVSPMAFAYHYLAAVAFAPALLDRLGTARGGGLLWLAILPTVMALPLPLPPPPLAMFIYQSMGTVGMAVLTLALLIAARAGPRRRAG